MKNCGGTTQTSIPGPSSRFATAHLEVDVTTASLPEALRNVWCREQDIFLEVAASATQALAVPQDARASPQVTRHDCKRIEELERELLRKDPRPG